MEIDMRRSVTKNRKAKKSKGFNPSRDYVNDAVNEYLKKGGKITKIIEVPDEFDPSGPFREPGLPADDFLLGH